MTLPSAMLFIVPSSGKHKSAGFNFCDFFELIKKMGAIPVGD